MSNRYAPLPNPRSDRDAQHEMEAAFDDSDDEDEGLHNSAETHPLNPSTPSSPPTHHHHSFSLSRSSQSQNRVPGSYDFENVDYDYTRPPPGSPPPPSAVALPNSFGNSNGLIPSFNLDSSSLAPKRGWLLRILPARLAQRFSSNAQVPQGVVGGGTGNDGVFANVTAKPTRPVRIQDGDESYLVPEDNRAEAPPSYASAQADAVPPYWETTVHAPFSPDGLGEMIIDAMPTGSVFSFLWNMLVSISFQFVGFLLTYLLHTTHAARLGSRAGLGITLIQYGFALRNRLDSDLGEEGNASIWSDWRVGPDQAAGPMDVADPAAPLQSYPINSTMPFSPDMLTEEQANMLIADATTEWLSFFLMTVGWFVLLTSLLGFWRVKRWESGILASQRDNNPSSNQTQQPQSSDEQPISQFHRLFGLHNLSSRADFLRQGFGFGSSNQDHDLDEMAVIRAEEGNLDENSDERDVMLVISDDNPDRARAIRQALENERRLQEDLRAAGLL